MARLSHSHAPQTVTSVPQTWFTTLDGNTIDAPEHLRFVSAASINLLNLVDFQFYTITVVHVLLHLCNCRGSPWSAQERTAIAKMEQYVNNSDCIKLEIDEVEEYSLGQEYLDVDVTHILRNATREGSFLKFSV